MASTLVRIRYRPAALLGVLAATVLAVSAGTARATVRYVAPNGLDSNTGLSTASPWSLSKANASLVAGDVAILLPGNYGSTVIRPAANGTSTARITYVGSLSNPASTYTTGLLNLDARKYITVKGVQAGELWVGAGSTDTLSRAEGDTVQFCVIKSGLKLSGFRSHILDNVIGDGTTDDHFISGSQALTGEAASTFCTVRRNVFTLRTAGTSYHCMRWDQMRGMEFTDNTFNLTVDASASDSHFLKKFECQWNTFRRNRYNCTNLASYNAYMVQRNCVRYNVFDRDSIFEMPGSVNRMDISFSTSGNYPGCQGYNSYSNCFFKSRYIDVQNDNHGDSFFGCTFVCTGAALTFDAVFNYADSISFRHCTFFSSGDLAADLLKINNVTLKSNIFYALQAGCPIAKVPVSGAIDSNLVFSPVGSPSQAIGSTSCAAVSGASRWGNPLFANATYANFNPTPLTGSAAVGSQWKDGYVGAIDPFGPAPDATPPAAVTDLAFGTITETTLEVVWTAPGDDGTSGTVQSYDLRWSLSPIGEANFAAATRATPSPVPLAGGTRQSYLLQGLSPGTRYYVAIRATDDGGNISPMSNLPNALTSGTDTVPPARVTDLSTGS